MSRKTQITVPEDIDIMVQFYIESEEFRQGKLTWTQALLQLARKGYHCESPIRKENANV